MQTVDPLRIFVAMPGTDMGSNAVYKNPQSVKENLLIPVVEKLKVKLSRDIILVIEKDKKSAGVIHTSMFNEARDADVYIADLTGSNPNVYLELGVRWALRDQVTVLISQSVQDLRFNVNANRAIIYQPDNIIRATDDIVSAIEEGLKSHICDSPVRLNTEYITINKSQYEFLENEVRRLVQSQGEDLLKVAKQTVIMNDKIFLLNKVIVSNPASIEAYIELGKVYKNIGSYDNAIFNFEKAKQLNSDDAIIHREIGISYSKKKKPEVAISYLQEAVRINPGDIEAWSSLGGAYRRLGMISAPAIFDKFALEQARNSYQKAYDLDSFNLYAGLNVARLDILLSKWDNGLLSKAQQGFRKQLHLCRYAVETSKDDYWRLFDLADILLFTNEYGDAIVAYTQAINLIPPIEREDKLNSVLGPLNDYMLAGVLKGSLSEEVEKIVQLLESSKEASVTDVDLS